jgi:hypothetical protein
MPDADNISLMKQKMQDDLHYQRTILQPTYLDPLSLPPIASQNVQMQVYEEPQIAQTDQLRELPVPQINYVAQFDEELKKINKNINIASYETDICICVALFMVAYCLIDLLYKFGEYSNCYNAKVYFSLVGWYILFSPILHGIFSVGWRTSRVINRLYCTSLVYGIAEFIYILIMLSLTNTYRDKIKNEDNCSTLLFEGVQPILLILVLFPLAMLLMSVRRIKNVMSIS